MPVPFLNPTDNFEEERTVDFSPIFVHITHPRICTIKQSCAIDISPPTKHHEDEWQNWKFHPFELNKIVSTNSLGEGIDILPLDPPSFRVHPRHS